MLRVLNLEPCLAEPHSCSLVGLALDAQLLSESVPTNSSDWRLDALVVGDGSVVRGQHPAYLKEREIERDSAESSPGILETPCSDLDMSMLPRPPHN